MSQANPSPLEKCAHCGLPIERGIVWQMENGQTVCHQCCVADTRRTMRLFTILGPWAILK